MIWKGNIVWYIKFCFEFTQMGDILKRTDPTYSWWSEPISNDWGKFQHHHGPGLSQTLNKCIWIWCMGGSEAVSNTICPNNTRGFWVEISYVLISIQGTPWTSDKCLSPRVPTHDLTQNHKGRPWDYAYLPGATGTSHVEEFSSRFLIESS